MFGEGRLTRLAKLITQINEALSRIEALRQSEGMIFDQLKELDAGLNELRADLRVLKAEARADAMRETQTVINSVQGEFHRQLRDLAVRIDRLERRDGARPADAGRLPRIMDGAHGDDRPDD